MITRIPKLILSVFSVVTLLLCAVHSGEAFQIPQLPTPSMPTIPKVTSMEQLLPAAESAINNYLALKSHEKALIITDRSVPPLVTEAFRKAAQATGAHVDVIELNGFPDLSDLVEMQEKMFLADWCPDWVWEAVKESDVMVGLAFIDTVHLYRENMPVRKFLYKYKTRTFQVHVVPELLASRFGTFPPEIMNIIYKKLREQLAGSEGKRVRITDPEGTDVSFTVQPSRVGSGGAAWSYAWAGGNITAHFPPNFHANLGTLLNQYKADAEGVVVTSNTHVGSHPTMKFTIKDGKAVKVEGGGAWGDYVRKKFDEYKDIDFGNHPGPGVAWLEEASVNSNPKAFRFLGEYKGSPRFWGQYGGTGRSGVIHMAFGSRGAIPEMGIAAQHFDIELFYPTATIDGKKIIDNGHLVVLDDPEVRRVASKYGDPDDWLKEEWWPDIPMAMGQR